MSALPSTDLDRVSDRQAGDRNACALATGRRVLGIEADALMATAAALDQTFAHAVDMIAGINGRVIVTGMGKSGHIGRKIAATFASTGTPALFVHPAEASHGDLGMITSDDLVLALSNSGETPELADIVAYCRRFSISLMAIVGRAPSALAEAADLVLLLPDRPEACPMGLAPTTSTTAALALADALAIALLEHNGFDANRFGVFHPGGKLGRKLIKVEQLMHTRDTLPLVDLDASTADAILEMTTKRFGCVGVLDQKQELAGIITDGDLRRHMAPDLLGRPAAEVMTRSPRTIRPEALAVEALAVMNQPDRPITVMFVLESRRPVGILHMHDCLRAGVA
ncbi:MAG: KpsF/GutQ family sugar-phosphate isomerase [Alphaproteobacteria bacterium]|nr:KpsF/GutQ family sugar-phosphate isomerase [Alphaproteobacteria bacterium]